MNSSRVITPVLLAFTLATALALGAGGCSGEHPVRDRAQTVEVAARATQTAALVLSEAAYQDAAATCPAPSSAECLAPVRARWAPVDDALAVVRAVLAGWLERGDLGDAFGAAWVDLVRLSRSLGVLLR